ncbi:Pre-mRNA-splicing factor SYF1 [Mortierella polycephala]|uniref:Pre-mRNA-splicing factor SYF1 n=1 Tax=Mortierella polycephala TaxID=41804 RepID=A0A9P6QFL7_9FUNG|nr:Pre-mRNA-splicing factor SYF1 [Mortierella polycephala]
MPGEKKVAGKRGKGTVAQVPVPMDGVLEDSINITDKDLAFEEDLLRNPYSLRHWLRYLDHHASSSIAQQFVVYERAVKELPGSYKLWKAYLDQRRQHLAKRDLPYVRAQKDWEDVGDCYERALVLLHKMPRIWIDYLEHLMATPRITKTRRTFDRALRALPITQHIRIWGLYLGWAKKIGGETALKVYKRYLKLEPNHGEDYVDLLVSMERYDEAASRLCKMINNEHFQSMHGKSHYQLWRQLCDIICTHPKDIRSLPIEKIIRSGIKRFTDQTGRLWNDLAKYWILLNHFEKARDVYEEAITSVMTVRDFTQVFDAYAEFEESVISAKMEAAEIAEAEGEEVDQMELDMRLMRLERLMERRPFLVNEVLLRQNPNSVHEWQKRVELWGDNSQKVVDTYTKAVTTIHPKKSDGKLHTLWVNFAKFYEEGDDIASARTIFEKATKVNYKTVNDLADVWCEYAEMELRNENYDAALQVMGRATIPSKQKNVAFHDETLPVQIRVYKSLRLWSFYVDMEESIGTVDSTKAVYDKILELKIANPQIIVNYANFLEENKFFEDSYKVYERGIDLFGYPIAFELWNTYLLKFIDRYGGTKLERTRDLFEQALEKVPAKYAKPLYLMYGNLEETHGLARHAMSIYDRATKAVAPEDRAEMFHFYIAKAAAMFGVTSTREIYERAIEVLQDKDARVVCMRYADMERKLGEIDRARAILAHGSQFCDPRITQDYWQTWHDFEVQHGNEDTFKEMLRIKRSVQVKFNTDVSYITAQMLQSQEKAKAAAAGSSGDAMQTLDRMTGGGPGEMAFVKSKAHSVQPTHGQDAEGPESAAPAAPANPDEIAIGDDDEDL